MLAKGDQITQMDIPGPSQQSSEDQGVDSLQTMIYSRKFESPAAKLEYNPGSDHQVPTFVKQELESPSKLRTPLKFRTEIASLKEEIDELRQHLRDESGSKKTVMLELELSSKQLAASESRMRAMEERLKAIVQSKTTLTAEKATVDKELLLLKAKWEVASRKLSKIQEIIERANARNKNLQDALLVAEQQRDQALAQVAVEKTSSVESEKKAIEQTERLALLGRQIEHLQQELTSTKDLLTQKEQASELSEEHSIQIYSLANTVAQLRTDLEAEISLNTTHKTEIGILQTERLHLEEELQSLKLQLKTTVEQHSTELNTNDAELLQLKNKCNELNSRLEEERIKHVKEMLDLQEQVSTMSVSTTERESEIARLESELAHLQSTLADLTQSVSQRELDLSSQNRSLEALNVAILTQRAELKQECEELEEELNLKNTESKRMTERISFLESALTFVKGEMSAKSNELEELRTTYQQLAAQLESRESELERSKEIKSRLEFSLEEALTRLTILEGQLEQSKQQVTISDKNLERMSLDIKLAHQYAAMAQKNAKEELSASLAKLTTSEQHLEQTRQNLISLQNQYQALQSEFATLRTEYTTLTSSNSGMESQCEQLKIQLEKVTSESDSMKLQLENELFHLQAETQTKLNELEEKNKALAHTVEQGEIAHGSWERLTTSLQSTLAELEAELTHLKSEKSNLEIEVGNIKESQSLTEAEKHSLEVELAACRASLEEQSALIASKTNEMQTLQTTSATSAAHIAELEAKLESVTQQLSQVQDSKLILESANSTLQGELDSLRNETVALQSEVTTLQSAATTSQKLHEEEKTKSDSFVREIQEELESLRAKVVQVEADRLADQIQFQENIQVQLDLKTRESAEQLETLVAKHTSDMLSLQAERDELVKASQIRMSLLEEEKSKLQSDYSELSSATRELSSKLGEARDQITDLLVVQRQLESQVASSSSESTQLTAAIADTETHMRTLEAELDSLKKHILSQDEALKGKEELIKSLAVEKMTWMKQAEAGGKELIEVQESWMQANNENEALRAEIEELKSRKTTEAHDREQAELAYKKLALDARMMRAELDRQKSRLATRETSIASGKAREEKLQANLDAQIDKNKELQRLLADLQRETSISLRTKTTKPAPAQQTTQSVSSTTAGPVDPSKRPPTIDELNHLNGQLDAAREEIVQLKKMLEAEQAQIQLLTEEQTKLTGHGNRKQKIQLTERIWKENHELKLERAKLLAKLAKRPVMPSPRVSLTRSSIRTHPPASPFSSPVHTPSKMTSPSSMTPRKHKSPHSKPLSPAVLAALTPLLTDNKHSSPIGKTAQISQTDENSANQSTITNI